MDGWIDWQKHESMDGWTADVGEGRQREVVIFNINCLVVNRQLEMKRYYLLHATFLIVIKVFIK